MTDVNVGSIVNHWAHGHGVVLAIDTVAGVPAFINVRWNRPIVFDETEHVEVVHVCWTNVEDLSLISEAM